MGQAWRALLPLVLAATFSESGPSAEVVDVTLQTDFNKFVSHRTDVWVVVFCQGKPDATWAVAANKLKDVVRFARVDCARVRAGADGHAAAPCARAAGKSDGRRHLLGYTFGATGDLDVSAHPFVGHWNDKKIVKWALGLAPKLAVQLTAHAGVNVLHKEELGAFLKRPRMAKAIFFTTSPKGDPPSLVTALAVRFRQRMLVGEVKASDMTLRNAFSVSEPPAVVVVDASAKRHRYSGLFKRAAIEAFLEKFQAQSFERSLHESASGETQKVKVKRQAYSDAETQEYPRGFDPWTALGMARSRSIPAPDALKAAYKSAAKRWHPDKCQKDKASCEVRMSEAALANKVLSDVRQLQHWEAWRDDQAKGASRRKRSEL